MVVVARHRQAVRAGRGQRQHIARPELGQLDIPDQHVAGLAVLAGDGDPLRRRLDGPVRDERLVARLVHRRADVVRHAAIDRDVGRRSRHLLARAHGVERDAGARDDGPSRLHRQARLRQPFALEGGAQRIDDDLGVLVGRGRGLVAQVLDGEAAAGAVLAQLQAVLVAHAGGEGDHRVVRRLIRRHLKDGRAQVAVEAKQLQVRVRQRLHHRLLRLPSFDSQAELGVEHARRRLRVRVGVDVGRDAQQHRLAFAERTGDAVQQRQLVEVIDHDAAHARLDRLAQLPGRLVVAVEEGALHGEAGGAGDCQLAAGDDVQPQPFLRHERCQPAPQVRLRGVGDGAVLVTRSERLAIGAAGLTQLLLVEDVEGRAELLRQVDGVTAAQGQVAVRRRGRRARQHRHERRV